MCRSFSFLLIAAEMLRVGKRVYCQTPNRWFPVEPHYLALLVHWLPTACFTYFVHRYMTVHGLITKPSREKHERLNKPRKSSRRVSVCRTAQLLYRRKRSQWSILAPADRAKKRIGHGHGNIYWKLVAWRPESIRAGAAHNRTGVNPEIPPLSVYGTVAGVALSPGKPRICR
jgi:hypothetical protein